MKLGNKILQTRDNKDKTNLAKTLLQEICKRYTIQTRDQVWELTTQLREIGQRIRSI